MKVRYELVDIMKGFCFLVVSDYINVPGLKEYLLNENISAMVLHTKAINPN